MTILLFNDNPVVQKLVALSAQKTKDDLSIATSVNDIKESEYDLLILDDALYSDETFAAIRERTAHKSALFMATRGNVVPAGFDNIINKPFLPTDLVETLILIEKNLPSLAASAGESAFEEGSGLSINLDKTLEELGEEVHTEFAEETLPESEEEMMFGELEDFEEEAPKTAILDHEEVQEVRGLLEDTDSDEMVILGDEENEAVNDAESSEEDAFDFDALIGVENEETGDSEPPVTPAQESLDEFDFAALGEEETAEIPFHSAEEEGELGEMFGLLEEEAEMEEEAPEPQISASAEEVMGEEDLSDGLAEFEEEAGMEEEIPGLDEAFEESLLLDDEGFGELESQIQEAVEELEPEDLEMELDEGMLEELTLGEAESEEFASDLSDTGIEEMAGFSAGSGGAVGTDEFDMLDERELKRAIGEEVEEEEPRIRAGEGEFASLSAEALEEAMEEETEAAEELLCAPSERNVEAGSVEGVEALQALLKALSNEEVAKSLKGLNISININFGNDK